MRFPFSSERRSSGVVMPVLFGLGGVVLGAGLASMLTPRTGQQLRGLVRDLFGQHFGRSGNDPLEGAEIDRMKNEGGMGAVGARTSATNPLGSHS
jgi:hypothetical protein